MKIKFKVHNVSRSVASATTVIDGETVPATVPCLEVELVTLSERHGNVTFRFTGTAMADARELFQPDAVIVGGFEAE